MKRFKDVEAFYKDNKTRRTSGEVDFGVWWKSKYTKAPFRFSWIEDTGEFYSVNQWTKEVFLTDMVCKTREKAEAFMTDWVEKMRNEKIEELFPELSKVS